VKVVEPGYDETPWRLKVVSAMEDTTASQKPISCVGREQSAMEAHLEACVLGDSMCLGEALALDTLCHLPQGCGRCSQAAMCGGDIQKACDEDAALVVQVETFDTTGSRMSAGGARPEASWTWQTQPSLRQHPNIIRPPAAAALAGAVGSDEPLTERLPQTLQMPELHQTTRSYLSNLNCCVRVTDENKMYI